MLSEEKPTPRLKIWVPGRVLPGGGGGLVRGLPADLPPQVFLRATPLTEAGGALEPLAEMLAEKGGARIELLHRLNARLHSGLRFDTAATTTATAAEEAFGAGHGVCQDFAHIFIAVARRLSIPARYISGHLFRRDGAHLQPAAHAWAEAWVDDLGWIAFDPANGICTDDAYARVAVGLDYREASPVAGARVGGGTEALEVEVEVREARGQTQWQVQS